MRGLVDAGDAGVTKPVAKHEFVRFTEPARNTVADPSDQQHAIPPPPGSDVIATPIPVADGNATTHSRKPLSAFIGVRSSDSDATDMNRPMLMRDKPRTLLTPGHALVVIVLLMAILGLSLALIVQQSMNLTAIANAGVGSSSATVSGEETDNSANAGEATQTNEETPNGEHPTDDSSVSTDTRININTASSEELQSIIGVGPVTAQRIIDHRKTIGRYTSVDQLMDVTGIGSKTLEKMREQVKVE
ncbi:DNA uptake protein [Bifidobacterium imperatoris]|uniref:DNA uptake protein n=1 Tax=Bifidobacterium imperatoris TaxID=2020965 RepID=A0A2N5IRB1_9BIFI|nr:DNA uptake protein [Bifidobacterium imperatoris]